MMIGGERQRVIVRDKIKVGNPPRSLPDVYSPEGGGVLM